MTAVHRGMKLQQEMAKVVARVLHRGCNGKKRQNQSAPNLISSPAGFERTKGGRVGAASVLQSCVWVYVCGCVHLLFFCACDLVCVYGVKLGLHTVCQLH